MAMVDRGTYLTEYLPNRSSDGRRTSDGHRMVVGHRTVVGRADAHSGPTAVPFFPERGSGGGSPQVPLLRDAVSHIHAFVALVHSFRLHESCVTAF